MPSLFNKAGVAACFALGLGCHALAADTAELAPQPGAGRCVFSNYHPGTQEATDPVKRVAYFLTAHWPEVEHELASEASSAIPHGALAYVQRLALCAFSVPETYWSRELRGNPYEERVVIFTEKFINQCFCR